MKWYQKLWKPIASVWDGLASWIDGVFDLGSGVLGGANTVVGGATQAASDICGDVANATNGIGNAVNDVGSNIKWYLLIGVAALLGIVVIRNSGNGKEAVPHGSGAPSNSSSDQTLTERVAGALAPADARDETRTERVAREVPDVAI